MTDQNERILKILKQNCKKNKLKHRPTIKYLSWNESLESFQQENGSFDVIIASDVWYAAVNTALQNVLTANPYKTSVVIIQELWKRYGRQ